MESFKNYERIQIENGKSLTVTTHIAPKDFPMHWHNFFEIEILLSGKGTCIINDKEYDLSEYNMFFLTSTDFHYIKITDEARFINISFDVNMLNERDSSFLILSGAERGYNLSADKYERIISAAMLLQHECDTNGICQKQLLEYILSYISQKSEDHSSYSASSEQYKGIKKATIFMELHFRENITLKQIAKEAGYHPAYFSEIFKKITGESYIEALTRLRLAYAKSLLANGFSVADACFLSGFGSLSNFYTLFKKKFGSSPSGHTKKAKGV